MTLANEHTWLYTRIYHRPNLLDSLLLDLVKPVEHDLRSQGLITRFFFIRYNEDGLHLRLRFCGERQHLLGPVRAHLNQQIEAFCLRYGTTLHGPGDDGPSGMDDTGWQPQQRQGQARAIPSYEYDRYEPETTRYGGRAGLLASEKHFQLSSEMALRILEGERAGLGPRQNALLLLMEATTRAFGLKDQQQLEAFGNQCFHWLNTSWFQPRNFQQFANEYERYRQSLRRLVPLTGSNTPELRSRAVWTPLVQEWQRDMEELYRSLADLTQQMLLTTPIPLLMNAYIHLLCNRLGIFAREEACLAYFLYRSFAEQLDLPVDAFAQR